MYIDIFCVYFSSSFFGFFCFSFIDVRVYKYIGIFFFFCLVYTFIDICLSVCVFFSANHIVTILPGDPLPLRLHLIILDLSPQNNIDIFVYII